MIVQVIKDDVKLKGKQEKDNYMVIVKYKDDSKATLYECMENVIKRIKEK